MSNVSHINFGNLFKKFRLKSEFKTLSQLADELSNIGLHYEDSALSRWEHGNRIPERKVILSFIQLFLQKGGITNLDEVNNFLEAAGQGYVTVKEKERFSHWLIGSSPFQAPREIPHFTGRKSYLTKIKRQLPKGRLVVVYGPAGSGKTTLAIKIAHLVKDQHPDGILWLRVDTSTSFNILALMAESYGKDVSQIQDVNVRSSFVRSLLSSKRLLLILDNVEVDTRLDLILPNSQINSVLITTRNKNVANLFYPRIIHLSVFTKKESLLLFQKILGARFIKLHKKQLLTIAQLVGYLPLAINLIAQQLTARFMTPWQLIQEIQEQKLKLSHFAYEDRNLYTAITLSYKKLPEKLQKIFVSLAIFSGKDFSEEAVFWINKIDKEETKRVLSTLLDNSLLEYSSMGRFRLHPMIRFFLQKKQVNLTVLQRAIAFFIDFLRKKKKSDYRFSTIRQEIDNIKHIFDLAIRRTRFQNELINLWKELKQFLWFGGLWDDFFHLAKKLGGFPLSFKNRTFKVTINIDLSQVCYWRGKLDSAKEYIEKGLKRATRLGNQNLIAQCEDRRGKIYQLQRAFKKSFNSLTVARGFLRKTNDFEKVANNIRHFAEGYLLMRNFLKAEKEFKRAKEQYLQIKDPSINLVYQALINSHLAVAYLKQNKLEKAKKLFLASLRLEKRVEGRAGTKIGSTLGLGLIYEISHYSVKAKRYFRLAHKEIKLLGINKEVEKLNVCMSVLKEDLLKSRLYRSIFP